MKVEEIKKLILKREGKFRFLDLIWWSIVNSHYDFYTLSNAFGELYKEGKVKLVGVNDYDDEIFVVCNKTNNELYDEVITPLLDELLKVCNDNNIQMLAGFIFDENKDTDRTRLASAVRHSVEKENKEEMLRIVSGRMNDK